MRFSFHNQESKQKIFQTINQIQNQVVKMHESVQKRKAESRMKTQTEEAHKASSMHKQLVETSKQCGCFYCLSVFRPADIKEWTDQGQTALCPECGIDSVLPQAAGYELSQEFLSQMEAYWFGEESSD